MKKLFLIAVAGMMMFAFTQCGGAASSIKSAYESATESIKNAKNCDDFKAAVQKVAEISEKYKDTEISEEDAKAISEAAAAFGTAFGEKFVELKCADIEVPSVDFKIAETDDDGDDDED